MKIAILGFAGQGQSAFEYWNKPGNEVTICDRDTSLRLPDGAEAQLGNNYLKGLGQFDMLIRTPSLHPRDIVAANSDAPDILGKVWSNTNEFMKVCPSRNIIGVTGTKGKGTTSTLISKILEAAGKRVHLGGNIGIPPLELLKDNIQPDDWVVLELANFQLIDLKTSPHIGVCLMVEAEHMDWHEDMDEYIAAKQQLFMNQSEEDIAIYYGPNENSDAVASASQGKLIPYYETPGATVSNNLIVIDGQEICNTGELKLLGQHNWQNVCAAITAAWQVTQDVNAIRKAVTNFSGLPFRIEPRETKHGIRYYNDSFASQPEATIAALRSVPGTIVMIIGGFDRGLDVSHLAEELLAQKDTVRHVLLIGASAERVQKDLQAKGFTNFTVSPAKTMPEVVTHATEYAQPDDAVVLSPGFASFDMFKNFEDRGQQFNQAVTAL
jgi:UDP-N-acetylmuramoylalanine--D-glutamate ligase